MLVPMSVSTITGTSWIGLQVPAVFPPSANQTERILAALGPAAGDLPKVDQDTLARYYAYLSANLPLPFTAYYPQPVSAQEKAQFRCTVVELLDPARHLGDEFDGLFCKTRRGRFEVNLPLVELHVPHDNPAFQLVEGYGYWFLELALSPRTAPSRAQPETAVPGRSRFLYDTR